MEHIVIIGNGIAGITAARHIRKNSNFKITVISGESEYFFSRTALMYVYMGHMKWDHLKPYEDWFWDENEIELKYAWVENVDFKQKEIRFSVGEALSYDKLILATGSKTHFIGVEGEDLEGVQGLVSKLDLQLLEENTKYCRKAVIVGGGLIGVEFAEMLRTRNIEVSILLREKGFWGNVLPQEDAQLVSDHIQTHGVKILNNTELKEIKGDQNGRVKSIITKNGDEIDCDLVGICTGVKPNIEFLKDSELETDKGILVNSYLETNIPDVFAIGDCAQQREAIGLRKPVEAVWYTGRMMGETLAYSLTSQKRKYKPGNWFNSAKFFNIEYQTYGWVWNKPKNDEQHLHWTHPGKQKFITIAFNNENQQFLGINTFGIRMKHEVFDRWLTENRSISHVLTNLSKANFDPEFYNQYEKQILASFKNSLQLTET